MGHCQLWSLRDRAVVCWGKMVQTIGHPTSWMQAYQQLEVDEASAELQTIIAHKGVFKAKRLQFSIVSVPGIFQRFLDSLLANLNDVVSYFKDVLTVADSQHELLEVLRRVFDRLRDAGIWLNREKCVIVSNSVEFLGYRIDAEGIHLSEANKAEAAETLHRLLDGPTMKLENANALCQLPQTGKPNMCSGPLEVLLLESTPTLPISTEYLAKRTGKDAVLAHAQNWLKRVWLASNTSVTSCLLNDHSESETIKQLMILFLAAALSICNKSRRDSHAQLLSPAQELLHQSSIANLIRSNTVSDCSVTTKVIS
ncbi:Uncharacterized protein TSPI_04422 [Trichinella spiralis]|uniref:Reverse transcriptase domain-containing protein n=1 Tax=Trichinella spiralis TaxID=6334 RepID=A0ABR3KXK6_TRISP